MNKYLSNEVYSLLYNNLGNYYLATRAIEHYDDYGTYALFGLFEILDNKNFKSLTSWKGYSSRNNGNSNESKIRVMVSIDINIKINSNSGTISDMHTIG